MHAYVYVYTNVCDAFIVSAQGMKILDAFKPTVKSLPRLRQLINGGLGADGRVKLKMPAPSCTAGQSLRWSRKIIESILDKGPHVYKIGLTGDPMFRFYKKPSHTSPCPGYFHDRDKYQAMYLLFVGATWDEAALMEAILISLFQGKPGNRNIKPGGEGRQVYSPPYFTYLVYKSLAKPPSKR